MPVRHRERHRTEHTGWLRAAVLGANDGILSTASLVLGVAAAHGTRGNVFVARAAGLVAGAMSMAAGEYVSVHLQADTEQADLARERAELRADDSHHDAAHSEVLGIVDRIDALRFRLHIAHFFELSQRGHAALEKKAHW